MYFLFSLIPATFIVVLGYFILFSTTKSEGAVKMFGQILSIWVFVLAAFLPLAGAYATYAGFSMESMMRPMHSRDG